MAALTRDKILQLFALLDEELAREDVVGELCVVGGAVMCLSLGARASTHDVDALLEPPEVVRRAAGRVAASAGVSDAWLDDAVKGYLGPRNAFSHFLDLPHLRVYVAEPHYLFALKCASMRLGPEFHDLDDVRYLLRHLGIRDKDEALAIVARYVALARIPVKTRLALEELLA